MREGEAGSCGEREGAQDALQSQPLAMPNGNVSAQYRWHAAKKAETSGVDEMLGLMWRAGGWEAEVSWYF